MEVRDHNITHLPAHYSLNEIIEIVDSVDVDNPDRSGLVYHLELQIPVAFQSPDFVTVAHLSGHEKPPVELSGGGLQYEGWTVYLEEYLDSLLEWPVPNAPIISPSISLKSVTPYRVKSWAERNGTLVAGSLNTSEVKYAVKGKLGELELPGYPDFHSTYRSEKLNWLTRKPSGLRTGKNTPQILSYLVNSHPKPESLKVRVNLNYNDGTNEKFTAFTIANPLLWSIINVPCSYAALGIATKEADRLAGADPEEEKPENWHLVHNYDVYITNEDDKILAAPYKFILEVESVKEEVVIMMNNTLGGVDCVRFTGIPETSTSTSADVTARNKGVSVSDGFQDLHTAAVKGVRKYVLTTGPIAEPKVIEWMEEVQWAEVLFLIYDQGKSGAIRYLQPLVLENNSSKVIRDGVQYFSFEFTPGRNATATNSLQERKVDNTRATAWIPQGNYCLVDEKGLRTGYLGASRLKLYYTDVTPPEPVKGVASKPNVFGTEGYVPPVLSNICEVGTAPAYNTAISRMGTFKKQGCAVGFTGVEVLITVPAGMFGGNTVEEANKLAEAEWKRRNTQAAANANPSGCVAAPESYSDVTPAAGKAWFRWNSLSSPGAYSNHAVDKQQGEEFKGNAWWCWGTSASDVYAPGTNNIQLPVSFGPGNDWRFTVYGRSDGAMQYATVYINGAPVESGNGTSEFYLYIPHGDIVSGDRVYIKIDV